MKIAFFQAIFFSFCICLFFDLCVYVVGLTFSIIVLFDSYYLIVVVDDDAVDYYRAEIRCY
jgi:hypothetical protein